MTTDEIHELEQRMGALAREYRTTHNPEILAELKELSRRLRGLENILVQAGKSKTARRYSANE